MSIIAQLTVKGEEKTTRLAELERKARDGGETDAADNIALIIPHNSDNDTNQLLRLFRHTSFLWRIRGDETKEAEYLKRLDQKKIQHAETSVGKSGLLEVRYFLRRLQIVIADAIRSSTDSKEARS